MGRAVDHGGRSPRAAGRGKENTGDARLCRSGGRPDDSARLSGQPTELRTERRAAALNRLMAQRLKLVVAYDGAHFSGWQSQRHGKTVQDELERAFEQ